MGFTSLMQLADYRAARNGQAVFLSSPERQMNVTYGDFYTFARNLSQHFRQQGLSKGGRVAIVMDNGISWAITFFGILLAGGVAVPFNPRFKPAEIGGLLEQAAVQWIAADKQGANSLPPELLGVNAKPYQESWTGPGELFILAAAGQQPAPGCEGAPGHLDNEALLLFTSGSTGKPKGVVLSHGNLLAEAAFIQQGHQLTDRDIVLCILPFFHINGLVITLITTFYTGGRAVVPAKFSAGKFWDWITQYEVTWFSAVPTILSLLLSNKAKDQETRPTRLRFARSASSSLPVAILREFEQRYQVPVIESYGLSETGSQVATNPLPPATRKAGSVGLAAGNEIRIVDEAGRVLPNGSAGEVIIKGDNVTSGYLNNPQANQESFKDGWFYTGDLGYFDADDYLFLTGRRKELINRAGEKISPREVDEVIYQLPEVEVAAAVGVPDPLFGEEIVAFIQLRPGKRLSEQQVIQHCKTCLANFKVPKSIFYVTDFPKGANGKIQRRKLVELYGQKERGDGLL